MTRILYIPGVPAALLTLALALGLAGCTVSFGSSGGEGSDAVVDGDGAIGDSAAGDGSVNPDAVIDPDGCQPPSDQELCALQQQQCDPLFTLDHCGNMRDVAECGPCQAEHYCQDGACIAYLYSWVTGGWSACSVSCGGGSQTRSVVCQRDDGQVMDESYCTEPKPATSRSCNTQACCTPYCVPHDACGGDGCGGNCGSCAADRNCWNGYCIWTHGNDGTQTCNTICAWGVSSCVGTSSETCGTSGVSGVQCYCW